MKELLLTFFQDERHPGWRNIAEALIEAGECVIPNCSDSQVGGVWNFVDRENAIGFVDCVKLKFDLDYFKSSVWFKEHLTLFLAQKVKKREEIQEQLDEVNKTIEELQDEQNK